VFTNISKSPPKDLGNQSVSKSESRRSTSLVKKHQKELETEFDTSSMSDSRTSTCAEKNIIENLDEFEDSAQFGVLRAKINHNNYFQDVQMDGECLFWKDSSGFIQEVIQFSEIRKVANIDNHKFSCLMLLIQRGDGSKSSLQFKYERTEESNAFLRVINQLAGKKEKRFCR